MVSQTKGHITESLSIFSGVKIKSIGKLCERNDGTKVVYTKIKILYKSTKMIKVFCSVTTYIMKSLSILPRTRFFQKKRLSKKNNIDYH